MVISHSWNLCCRGKKGKGDTAEAGEKGEGDDGRDDSPDEVAEEEEEEEEGVVWLTDTSKAAAEKRAQVCLAACLPVSSLLHR